MHTSLLKYYLPIRLSPGPKSELKKKSVVPFTTCANTTGIAIDVKSDNLQANQNDEVKKLLETYFPPVIYKEMNCEWIKSIRDQACTQMEIYNLKEEITLHLKVRCARKIPLCDIRSDILDDSLREILRQLVIENSETGRLFKAIMENYYKDVDAYDKLMASSEAFTSRRSILASFWRGEGDKVVHILEGTKRQLEVQLNELKHRVDQLEKKNQEAKAKRDLLRSDEIKFLKWRSEQLKTQIDASAIVQRVENE